MFMLLPLPDVVRKILGTDTKKKLPHTEYHTIASLNVIHFFQWEDNVSGFSYIKIILKVNIQISMKKY